jgi:glycosyltransferase involved in cell wall biosynthesis
MTAPLPLGIVVPALNAAATLPDTLRSLAPARHDGADVVLVDGGSTDGTPAIAADYGVRVLHHPGGLYAALNAGFRSIQTDWCTWINADDLLFCDLLPARIAAHGTAEIFYGRVDYIDGAGRFMHSWMSAAPHQLLSLYRAGYSPLLQQGTLFARRVFDRLGGFDESYRLVGDADFWWRALEAGFSAARTPRPPVAAFRLHPRQLSQQHAAAMRSEHLRMVRQHGGPIHSARAFLAAAAWRGRNAASYALRFMRRHQLDGSIGLPGSYQVYSPRD